MKNLLLILSALFLMILVACAPASQSTTAMKVTDTTPGSGDAVATLYKYRVEATSDSGYDSMVSWSVETDIGLASESLHDDYFNAKVTKATEFYAYNIRYSLAVLGPFSTEVKVYRSAPPYDTEELVKAHSMIYSGSTVLDSGDDSL